jgi:DnaD/phage-associated family protein
LTGADDALERGLELAVRRGTLLRARTRADGRDEELYGVNSPGTRKALEELAVKDIRLDEPLPAAGGTSSGIFSLYEQNIRPITPLIAEELTEAEKRYPADWITNAFREAVSLNKPNWRYIESILRRWEAEGRSDEKPGRDPQVEWLERRYREGKRRLTSRPRQ